MSVHFGSVGIYTENKNFLINFYNCALSFSWLKTREKGEDHGLDYRKNYEKEKKKNLIIY